MSAALSQTCDLDQHQLSHGAPQDGANPPEPLIGADTTVSFDAAVCRYRLPDQLDDSGSSRYVSPMADADTDSDRSLAMSPVGFAGSVASHNTMQTEVTTPESATVPLPKAELYPTTQASPKRQGKTFSLPPSQKDSLPPVAGTNHALAPDHNCQLHLASPPGHSTPVLESNGSLWMCPPALEPIGAGFSADDEDEEVKYRRLEQSLDLLVFNDKEDSGDMSQPLLEDQPLMLRSLGSEKIVVVFRSPTLSEPQSARVDKFDTPLMASPGLGCDVPHEVEAGMNRAVLMSPQEATALLGFEPVSDVVVATVDDAHEAALDALRSPESENLDLASAPPLGAGELTPECLPDTNLDDFSFLCDVMDTSATQDDSFFSSVSEQADTSTLGNPNLSYASSVADQSTTADCSASSILARPRPQTYRSTRYSSPFVNSDAPVVVPKRNCTIKMFNKSNAAEPTQLGGARYRSEKSNLVQQPKAVQRSKSAEKPAAKTPATEKPTTMERSKEAKRDLKFDLPIRPQSIRRASARRKWTASYIDSTGRGVPHGTMPKRSMLDRSRFDAKAPKKPRAQVDPLLSSPQEPLKSRGRYPTVSTLISDAKPLPVAPAVVAENQAAARTNPSNPSTLRSKDNNDLDLLVNVKPAKNRKTPAKATAEPEPANAVCEKNGEARAKTQEACDASEQLRILREAIALAQEEVARLESAERAARRGRKGGGLLSSLRSKPAGLKRDQSEKAVIGVSERSSKS